MNENWKEKIQSTHFQLYRKDYMKIFLIKYSNADGELKCQHVISMAKVSVQYAQAKATVVPTESLTLFTKVRLHQSQLTLTIS